MCATYKTSLHEPCRPPAKPIVIYVPPEGAGNEVLPKWTHLILKSREKQTKPIELELSVVRCG